MTIEQKNLLFQPKADSPRLTGLLFANSEKELCGEYALHAKDQSVIPVELQAFNLIRQKSSAS